VPLGAGDCLIMMTCNVANTPCLFLSAMHYVTSYMSVLYLMHRTADNLLSLHTEYRRDSKFTVFVFLFCLVTVFSARTSQIGRRRRQYPRQVFRNFGVDTAKDHKIVALNMTAGRLFGVKQWPINRE